MSFENEIPVFLGIECGGTKSMAVIHFADGSRKFFKFGPANFAILAKNSLQNYLLNLRDVLAAQSEGIVQKLGIGMPGILSDEDRQTLREIVNKIWPNLQNIWVGNDPETALACLEENSAPRLTVISGTGSCCYGTNGQHTLKIGGYGHVIGDHGSGYDIALRAIRGAILEDDLTNKKSDFLRSILKALDLESLNALVTFSVSCHKDKIAGLIPIIFAAWNSADEVATKAVNQGLDDLVDQAAYLANSLTAHGSRELKIGLAGSLLTESLQFQSEFVHRFRKRFEHVPEAEINFEILRDTCLGALKLAMGSESNQIIEKSTKSTQNRDEILSEGELKNLIVPIRTDLSPTECRNPKSKNLDNMTIPAAVDLWIEEESSIYSKILEHKNILEEIILQVTKTFRNGGRLFYVGAGTSGRLGILDASECPPTFQSPPEWVQGIIAGGDQAIQNSMEAAEDSILGGMQAVSDRGVNERDIIIATYNHPVTSVRQWRLHSGTGIASSGTTPFVWGALYKAKELGAFTSFVTFNPNLRLKFDVDKLLCVNVGPEILTGSTRLKCGSATKCILNMITTLSMVQYGKCFENLMVDLAPACDKLRERALRIVLTLVNNQENGDPETKSEEISQSVAETILVKNNFDIKKTVHELKKNPN